jgi:hypothetical protein
LATDEKRMVVILPVAFEDTRAVVYDFCESRAGENARTFLGDWRGNLVCDDFSGYVVAKNMLR